MRVSDQWRIITSSSREKLRKIIMGRRLTPMNADKLCFRIRVYRRSSAADCFFPRSEGAALSRHYPLHWSDAQPDSPGTRSGPGGLLPAGRFAPNYYHEAARHEKETGQEENQTALRAAGKPRPARRGATQNRGISRGLGAEGLPATRRAGALLRATGAPPHRRR